MTKAETFRYLQEELYAERLLKFVGVDELLLNFGELRGATGGTLGSLLYVYALSEFCVSFCKEFMEALEKDYGLNR